MPEHENRVILCIDDNAQVLECLERYLCRLGHTVLTASSGARGLELVGARVVDAVIVDGQMPGMDGARVALELRRMGLHAPIIMFSGQEDVANDTLELVDAFVPKGRTDSLPFVAQCLDNLILATALPAAGVAVQPEIRRAATR